MASTQEFLDEYINPPVVATETRTWDGWYKHVQDQILTVIDALGWTASVYRRGQDLLVSKAACRRGGTMTYQEFLATLLTQHSRHPGFSNV
jgi:hypothetical protein